MRNESKSDLFYLKSILLAIDAIDSHRRSPSEPKVVERAVIFELMTIGEAATRVSATLKKKHPHVKWREIEGTRHRIVHEYFRIDPDLITEIITDDLPELARHIEAILKELEHPHG